MRWAWTSCSAQVLHKVAPQIQMVSPQRSMSQINEQGLAAEYTQMRVDAEQSHILNRESLKKLGDGYGRSVCVPAPLGRLHANHVRSLDLPRYWSAPYADPCERSANVAPAVEYKTGELLWASMAEGTMQSEAVSKDPVYFEDAARVALGSIVSDFLNRKTASTYTPLDKLLDQLIEVPPPEANTQRARRQDTPGSQIDL